MSSESGDYEEDWEAAEPSIIKKSLLLTSSGQIGLLEKDECNETRDVEPTRKEEHDFPEKNYTKNEIFDKRVALTMKENESIGANALNLSTSEGALSRVKDDKSLSTAAKSFSEDFAETHHLLDLVRIHGHHYTCCTPPPVPMKFSTLRDTHAAKSPPKSGVGALQACVAAKRVEVFKRRQACEKEEEQSLELAWIQKRRDIRRSNDTMHKVLGVAGLTAQDHLRIARVRHKREAKEREIAASAERQHRWYHCIPKRRVRAPEHIHELQRRHSRVKRDQKQAAQFEQKAIEKNQLELQVKARAIISKQSGAYVPGSYLLKVTRHTVKNQSRLPANTHKAYRE